jgi:hypothetical protein
VAACPPRTRDERNANDPTRTVAVFTLASVLADIQWCIDAKLYYPALLIALTVPEISSALALDNTVFVKAEHYIPFVDKYTTPEALGCDGQMCYRLRGGIVHRASCIART